jgi:hypothetical protein
MNNSSREKLALFGRNRYHDWSILFISCVVVIIIGIICNVLVYLSNHKFIDERPGASEAVSGFTKFKDDLDFVSSYITNRKINPNIVVPSDPSLR